LARYIIFLFVLSINLLHLSPVKRTNNYRICLQLLARVIISLAIFPDIESVLTAPLCRFHYAGSVLGLIISPDGDFMLYCSIGRLSLICLRFPASLPIFSSPLCIRGYPPFSPGKRPPRSLSRYLPFQKLRLPP
jgi:hypothetical protein